MEVFLKLLTGVATKAGWALSVSAIVFAGYILLRKKWPSWAEILILLSPMVLLFYAVWRYAPEAPFLDDFDAILHYLSVPDRWHHLLDFHNEHRILVPRLFFEGVWLAGGTFSFRACMMCGDVLLCTYVWACWRHFRQTVGGVWFLPLAWFLLDLCNYENTMWALCAVQNQGVILFSFLSILCYGQREKIAMVVLSLLFAILATVTSGSGLGVWPTLVLMEIGVSFAKGQMGSAKKEFVLRILGLTLLACIVTGLYFIGFGQRPPGPPLRPFSVVNALDFVFSFMGAVVPVHGVALPMGVLMAVPVIYLLVTFRRRLREPMFYFFLFLLSVVAAGVLTRSRLSDPLAAVHLRYRIVTFSLMLSVLWLLVRELPEGWRHSAWIRIRIPTVLLAIAISANLAELVIGGQLVSLRRERVEHLLTAYPDFRDCPDVPDPMKDREIIDAAVRTGVMECPVAMRR